MGVVKLYPKNAAEDPDAVLEQAIGNYTEVLIIGWDKQNLLDVWSTSTLSHEQVLWLIQQFKHKLLNGDYSDGD